MLSSDDLAQKLFPTAMHHLHQPELSDSPADPYLLQTDNHVMAVQSIKSCRYGSKVQLMFTTNNQK